MFLGLQLKPKNLQIKYDFFYDFFSLWLLDLRVLEIFFRVNLLHDLVKGVFKTLSGSCESYFPHLISLRDIFLKCLKYVTNHNVSL